MRHMAHMGGEASRELDVPIRDLWPIVEDVASAPNWQDGLEEMNVRERDAEGRVLLAESVSDAKVRQIRSVVRFTYTEPTRLGWVQVKGDLKSLDGAWELEDLGGGRTRITYRLDGDPGRVLGMLIRGPVEDRLRNILVGRRPDELAARAGAP
jgi:ribosome-associated toxin RatA of RatAB toxin-antitoxin module